MRRGLSLDTTLGGAGRLTGDLSARCTAALQAVLDSLGKKMGSEDVRSVPQRQHDALEEACRRLLAAGTLPDRAGQPAQLQLHLSLDQLLNGIGQPGRPSCRPASPSLLRLREPGNLHRRHGPPGPGGAGGLAERAGRC